MRDIFAWWFKFQWGGQYACPFVWIGPVIIVWRRPYGAHERDVEQGRASRFYWPREVKFGFYPVAD
jgi:hypothetical protein